MCTLTELYIDSIDYNIYIYLSVRRTPLIKEGFFSR